MSKKLSKEEQITEFREKTLPYYKKMAINEQSENINNEIKRKIGIKKQLNILSDILSYQNDSIKQLKDIINIKSNEIERLTEKVNIFTQHFIKEDNNLM